MLRRGPGKRVSKGRGILWIMIQTAAVAIDKPIEGLEKKETELEEGRLETVAHRGGGGWNCGGEWKEGGRVKE